MTFIKLKYNICLYFYWSLFINIPQKIEHFWRVKNIAFGSILHSILWCAQQELSFVTWMHPFLLIFLWFIYQNISNSQKLWNNTHRYEILYTLYLGCNVLVLLERRAIINDLDVILHGFMLQIIYTTFFELNG